MLKRTALVGVSLAMLMTPASAATTKADVIAACTSSVASVAATCSAVLAAYIAEVKAAGVDVDAKLGALAYDLVLSPNLSAVKDLVGNAIQTIANNIADTRLKTSLGTVANDVKDDGVIATPPTKAYSPGSPSGN